MKKRVVIDLTLLIIWMILIFIMSSFDGNESSNQSNFIVSIISKLFNIDNISTLNTIIRKLAHFTEYLILGILMYNYIIKKNRSFITIIVMCILYAFTDEIHQIYVPGRTFAIKDILIDSFGSLIGILTAKKLIK